MLRTDNPLLNPIVAWTNTVQRLIVTIPDWSEETKVCAFGERVIVIKIAADVVQDKLKSVIKLMKKSTLGFNQDEVGLHLLRAGGAMTMFLSGVNKIIIQQIGC